VEPIARTGLPGAKTAASGSLGWPRCRHCAGVPRHRAYARGIRSPHARGRVRRRARWRSWIARRPPSRCARPRNGQGNRRSCGRSAPTPSLLRIATKTTLIDVAIPLSLIARYAEPSAGVRAAAALPAPRSSGTASTAKPPSRFCVRGDAYACSLTRTSGKQQLLAAFDFARKPQKRQPADARQAQNGFDCQKCDCEPARPLPFACSFCALSSSYIGVLPGHGSLGHAVGFRRTFLVEFGLLRLMD
jgi:hypothetical protein